jgi:type I restriction enzyme S subunit
MITRKWQCYPSYKDSGVEWLGEVPEGWDVKKLKYIGKAIIGLTYSPSDITDEQEGTLVLRSSNLQNGRIKLDDNVFVKMKIPISLRTREKDILICSRNGSRSLIGKNALIEKEATGICFGAFTTVFRSQYNNFLFYIFNSNIFLYQSGLCVTSTINQLTTSMLNNFEVALPPLPEQEQIAQFLDRETAKIDLLIAKKERLIELLKEKRTALISHAVTKGLNPDAPMKDSGVEWLGEVPESWKIIPIKFALSIPITDGPHETPELHDEGIPFISAESIKNDRIDFDKKRGFISLEEHKRFSRKYKPQYGDVYMVKSGATTGNVARVETNKEFNIWSPLAVLRPDKNITTTNFLFYAMKSKPFFYSVELSWSFGTQQNIGMGVISNIRIVSPPSPNKNRSPNS